MAGGGESEFEECGLKLIALDIKVYLSLAYILLNSGLEDLL